MITRGENLVHFENETIDGFLHHAEREREKKFVDLSELRKDSDTETRQKTMEEIFKLM